MKKRFSIAALAVSLLLVAASPGTAFAEVNNGVNGGKFTNRESLTWTANDGTVTTYGRGPKFSDVRPDITDPEYFLKEYNLLTEETYSPEIVAEIRKFVNSFDWIHSDELTRADMVYNRIANGCNGNVYAYPGSSWYPVLMTGKGQCGDFSGEFKDLARYVGLECEVYTPSYLHQACLLKINGQWFALDPTDGIGFFVSNGNMYPVDYETEFYRWEKEAKAGREAYYAANPETSVTLIAEANKKTSEGLITESDWARVNPLFAEIDTQLMNGTITAEVYEAKNVEILKLLLGK